MAASDRPLKKFETSAKNAQQKAEETELVGDPIPLEIDGRKITFYPPDTAQYILMIAGLEAAITKTDRLASLINIFMGMLRGEDKRYVVDRLRDQEDDFGVTELTDIIGYVTEEWSATPTEEPSGSSSKSASSGKSSKGKRHHAAHQSGATT